MLILNLTQHPATPEQRAAGVVDLPESQRKRLLELLTIEPMADGLPPSSDNLRDVAIDIAELACQNGLGHDEGDDLNAGVCAMIGGALYLMAPLERALWERNLQPCYAFSRRESTEEKLADDSVRKVAIFRHIGFVWPE